MSNDVEFARAVVLTLQFFALCVVGVACWIVLVGVIKIAMRALDWIGEKL